MDGVQCGIVAQGALQVWEGLGSRIFQNRLTFCYIFNSFHRALEVASRVVAARVGCRPDLRLRRRHVVFAHAHCQADRQELLGDPCAQLLEEERRRA